MLRISVSDLDSYLYWRESEEAPLDELLMRLRGCQDENDQMRAGKALKSFFARAGEGEILNVTVDGIQFVFAIDEDLALPALQEQSAERVLHTRSGPVKLVGRIDGLEGDTLTMFKLTEKFDVERYIDSYQWRSYLALFNARRFDYHVFCARYDTNRDGSLRITLHDYHRLPVYTYGGLVDDVDKALDGLAEIVAKHMPDRS